MEQRYQLTTKRLALRPLVTNDAARLHELWTASGVRRFLWDDEVIPMARTLAAIEQSQRLFSERGFGLWGAWSIEPPRTLVGFGGLWPFRDPPEIELLYGVAESSWGRGYATNIASAVTTYCFDVLGMLSVRASTDVANVASIRVLDKLGYVFIRRAVVDGLDTVFCERHRQPTNQRFPQATDECAADRCPPI